VIGVPRGQKTRRARENTENRSTDYADYTDFVLGFSRVGEFKDTTIGTAVSFAGGVAGHAKSNLRNLRIDIVRIFGATHVLRGITHSAILPPNQ
jgi:hypothetical protein